MALVEETFFRGAVQGSMTRAGSLRAAIFAVPVFYAAIHFFGEAVRVPVDQVTATSGFVIFAGFLRKFAYPGQIVDAFIALYFIGVMLGLLRHYTGNIAACIGLHAGIVAAFIVVRKASTYAPDADWSFLVGPFDHVLGVWASGRRPVRLPGGVAMGRKSRCPGATALAPRRGHVVGHGDERRFDLP